MSNVAMAIFSPFHFTHFNADPQSERLETFIHGIKKAEMQVWVLITFACRTKVRIRKVMYKSLVWISVAFAVYQARELNSCWARIRLCGPICL